MTTHIAQSSEFILIKLNSYYDSREAAILKCIEHSRKIVETSKLSDDISEIREKNRNLRMFLQEQEIESINKARSLKAVDERCRKYS